MSVQSKQKETYTFLRQILRNSSLSDEQKIAQLTSEMDAYGKNPIDFLEPACQENASTEILRFLLKSGAQVQKGEPLDALCAHQDVSLESIKLLLDHGAVVQKEEPLIRLCKDQNVSIDAIRLLLEYGADAKDGIALGELCAHPGVSKGHMQLLLDHGADGCSAIRARCFQDVSVSELQWLFNYACKDIDCATQALINAVEGKRASLEVVQFLIDKGARLDTGVCLAAALAYNSPIEYVRLLIQRGADVNASPRVTVRAGNEEKSLLRDCFEITPCLVIIYRSSYFPDYSHRKELQGVGLLAYAIIFKASPEVVSLLLESGADVHKRSCYAEQGTRCEDMNECRCFCGSNSALLLACEYADDVSVLEELIAYGADANDWYEDSKCTRYSALTLVCIFDKSPEFALCLLEHGAEVNHEIRYRRTNMHMLFGYCDSNFAFEEKTTFLHTIETAKVLLQAGASVSLGVLEDALNAKVPKNLILFLLEEGIEIDAELFSEMCNQYPLKPGEIDVCLSQGGYTADFCKAIVTLFKHEHAVHETIRHLLSLRPANYFNRLFSFDNSQYKGSVLHYAVQAGRSDIVQLLLAAGLDSTVKDSFGRSALDCARLKGIDSLFKG